MKISSDFFDLHVIEPTIVLDENNIKNYCSDSSKINYFLQYNNLFKLKFAHGGSLMLESCDEDFEKIRKFLPESKYKKNTVYCIDNPVKNKILGEDFLYIMKYFREVFKKHGTECSIILLYNQEEGKWTFIVPVQIDCTGSSVTYVSPTINEKDAQVSKIKNDKHLWKKHLEVCEEYNNLFDNGFEIAGTIHSHCDFSAFHSGVDDNDEQNKDGLHITIGNVDKNFSFSARYMCGGAEIKLTIQDCIENFDHDNFAELVDEVEIDTKYVDYVNKIIVKEQSWLGFKEQKNSSYGSSFFTYNYPYNSDQNELDEIRSRLNGGKTLVDRLWDDNDDDEDDYDLSDFNVVDVDRAVEMYDKDTNTCFYVDINDYQDNIAFFGKFDLISMPKDI